MRVSLMPREGLINSRFHSEFCFWGSRQDEFGGQPLFREPFGGAPPLSEARCPFPGTCSLRFRQEPPSCHVQIRQATADLEPVGVLRQPPVPDFGPAEDPLDHQERMFDLCRTFDFVRFRSRSSSLSGRWR